MAGDDDEPQGQPGQAAPPWEPDALETVTQNRWYVLAETDDGYGIWTRNRQPTDPPFASFGEDVEGFAAADAEFRRRTHRMRLFAQLPEILVWVVAVGVILWVVLTLVATLAYLTNIFGNLSASPGVSEGFIGFLAVLPRWLSEFAQVAYATWLGALGLMLALWLLRRAREEPLDA